jgi:epoxyqueuosine reductase QueG
MKRFAAGFVLSLSMALVAFARISYRTIENRDATPLEFRPPIANRVFACDICQEGVSIQQRSIHADHQRAGLPPEWRGAEDRPEAAAGLPGTNTPSRVELMRMSREEWNRWTRPSSIRRAGYP